MHFMNGFRSISGEMIMNVIILNTLQFLVGIGVCSEGIILTYMTTTRMWLANM